MENNIQIFKNEQFGEIKKNIKNNKYLGFFYFLEYGNMVKIGSTQNPHQRLMTLKHNGENYGDMKIGRFALSPAHTNYVYNESLLLKHFSLFRKGNTELFNLKLEYIIENMPNNIYFLDNSKEIEDENEKKYKAMIKLIGRKSAIKNVSDIDGYTPPSENDTSEIIIERGVLIAQEILKRKVDRPE